MSVAVLYGSYTGGKPHKRSDIDLAVFLKPKNRNDEIEIINGIVMSVERDVNIQGLDDKDESPFVIQGVLEGIHAIEPVRDCLYHVAHRVLHEAEGIRFRRKLIEKG